MIVSRSRRNLVACLFGALIMCFGLMSIARSQQTGPGPDLLPPAFQHPVGDPVAGQTVFRYETFGNQGFWTDAMQLRQGIAAAKLTPLQALQIGPNVNVAALNAPTVAALTTALQQVQSGMNPANTAFGDPNVTLSLIEQQAIQYLTGTSANGQRHYPVGQFDSFPDGIGAPTHNPPFFRTDLSAPWGVDGAVNVLNDFNNFVYTVSLDPTSILTTAGKQFLHTLARQVGDEITADYEQVLKTIGVIPAGSATLSVVPFVKATSVTPTTDGGPVGLRVDATKLNNLNAYTNSLQSPAPGPFDLKMAALGQAIFAGVRAILVHAISEVAKRFYEKYGFVASPVDPMTVMITTAEAAKLIGKF